MLAYGVDRLQFDGVYPEVPLLINVQRFGIAAASLYNKKRVISTEVFIVPMEGS